MISEDIQRTLFEPIEKGDVTIPEGGSILFINIYHPLDIHLHNLKDSGEWGYWQPYRPFALKANLYEPQELGIDLPPYKEFYSPLITPSNGGKHYDLILFNLFREVERSESLLRLMNHLLKEGGNLVCCAGNRMGAKKFQRRLEEICGGPVRSLSKRKCRVMWYKNENLFTPKESQFEENRGEEIPVRVIPTNGNSSYMIPKGTFSSEGIDEGSAFLIETIRAHAKTFNDFSGKIYDLGGGWGYLSAELLQMGIKGKITLLEADMEALYGASMNLAKNQSITCRWCDVTRELPNRIADTVIMNPPFHLPTGTEEKIGEKFIRGAAKLLRDEGILWLVANKHLPYEEVLREEFRDFNKISSNRKFKVLRGRI